jgi:hypothetical protein
MNLGDSCGRSKRLPNQVVAACGPGSPMRVGTMRRASLLTVGQRVGCSGAYSARLDPQTERAQVERGPRNVSSVWVCACGDPRLYSSSLGVVARLMASYAFP